MGHGPEDAGLRQQHHQDHRGQSKHDPDLDQRREPADAGGVDADGDRVRHIQFVERHDAGENEADGTIKECANHQGAEDADRHVAAGCTRFLGRGRHGVEADIGEEHHRSPAQHAGPAKDPHAGIGRNEVPVRVGGGDPIRGRKGACRKDEEQEDDGKLHCDDDIVHARGCSDPDHQQDRDGDDDGHRGNVEDGARGRPGLAGGIIGEGCGYELCREIDAEILCKADDIAGPADRHRNGADRIFQDKVPSDDPGHDLAERGVGIGVGAAADRHGRRHFRIAQACEGAGHRAEQERQRYRRSGIRCRSMSRQHKDAGADHATHAKRDQMQCGKRTLQGPGFAARVRFRRFPRQHVGRLDRPNVRQVSATFQNLLQNKARLERLVP